MRKSVIGSSSGYDESASATVVRAVARHRGVEPTALSPLYEWIDPDALDALFESTMGGVPRNGRVEFAYDGHEIVVAVDGERGVSVDVDGTAVAQLAVYGSPTDADADECDGFHSES